MDEKSEMPDVDNKKTNSNSKSIDAYADELRIWLKQAYYWQCAAIQLPYFLASQQQGFSAATSNSGGTVYTSQQNVQQRATTQAPRTGLDRHGVIYLVPPLWKRFVAELIDFMMVFIWKIILTIAVDYGGLLDLEKYDLLFLQAQNKLSYRLAMEMTTELVMLGLANRLVVCIFETMCLRRGALTPGGSTPGKRLMGLKVILCDQVTSLGDNQVLASPGGDLGVWLAFGRSFLKNFGLEIFFPLCRLLFFFQHNRMSYDVLCRSLVVEVPRTAQRE